MNLRHLWAAALVCAGLAACGGSSDSGGGGIGGTGSMHVQLTDAPSCGYDAVNVTIDRVRVHQSSTASEIGRASCRERV